MLEFALEIHAEQITLGFLTVIARLRDTKKQSAVFKEIRNSAFHALQGAIFAPPIHSTAVVAKKNMSSRTTPASARSKMVRLSPCLRRSKHALVQQQALD